VGLLLGRRGVEYRGEMTLEMGVGVPGRGESEYLLGIGVPAGGFEYLGESGHYNCGRARAGQRVALTPVGDKHR
jgi:hypothetical protein